MSSPQITHLQALENGEYYLKGDILPVISVGEHTFSVVCGLQTVVGLTAWIGSKFRPLTTVSLIVPTLSVDELFDWLPDAVEEFNGHTLVAPIKWDADPIRFKLTGSYYVDEGDDE